MFASLTTKPPITETNEYRVDYTLLSESRHAALGTEYQVLNRAWSTQYTHNTAGGEMRAWALPKSKIKPW